MTEAPKNPAEAAKASLGTDKQVLDAFDATYEKLRIEFGKTIKANKTLFEKVFSDELKCKELDDPAIEKMATEWMRDGKFTIGGAVFTADKLKPKIATYLARKKGELLGFFSGEAKAKAEQKINDFLHKQFGTADAEKLSDLLLGQYLPKPEHFVHVAHEVAAAAKEETSRPWYEQIWNGFKGLLGWLGAVLEWVFKGFSNGFQEPFPSFSEHVFGGAGERIADRAVDKLREARTQQPGLAMLCSDANLDKLREGVQEGARAAAKGEAETKPNMLEALKAVKPSPLGFIGIDEGTAKEILESVIRGRVDVAQIDLKIKKLDIATFYGLDDRKLIARTATEGLWNAMLRAHKEGVFDRQKVTFDNKKILLQAIVDDELQKAMGGSVGKWQLGTFVINATKENCREMIKSSYTPELADLIKQTIAGFTIGKPVVMDLPPGEIGRRFASATTDGPDGGAPKTTPNGRTQPLNQPVLGNGYV